MGFRVGAYAKVWKVEDKGNYTEASISISRKVMDKYETSFRGFVRFVGEAHLKGRSIQEVEGGTTIKILSCDVTNRYVKETNKEYTNCVIYDFEFPMTRNSGNSINQQNSNTQNNGAGRNNSAGQGSVPNVDQNAAPPNDGFMDIPGDTLDDELPFN